MCHPAAARQLVRRTAASGSVRVGCARGLQEELGACLCVWYIWNFRRADCAFVYRAVHLFVISILSCVNPVWLLAAA